MKPPRDKLDGKRPPVSKAKREKVDLSVFEDDEEDYEAPITRKKKKKISKLSEKLKDKLKDVEEGEEIQPSVFQDAFAELRRTLTTDNEEISLDLSTPAFLRASLLMLTDLIPIAEAAYRKSRQQSAAYALSTLVNQVRDINNDLKVSEDIESKALAMRRMVDSTFVSLAQLIMQEKFAFQERVNNATNDTRMRKVIRSEADTMLKSMGHALTEHSTLLSDRVRAYLMGNPNYMNPSMEEKVGRVKSKKVRRKEEE